jgi:hypothetical protein
MHRQCQFQVSEKSRKIINLRPYSSRIAEPCPAKSTELNRRDGYKEYCSLIFERLFSKSRPPAEQAPRRAGGSDQDNRQRRRGNSQRISARCVLTLTAALFWQRWCRAGSRLRGGGGRWSCGRGGNRRGCNCFDPPGRRRGRSRGHLSVRLSARRLRRTRGRRWNCSCGGGSRLAVRRKMRRHRQLIMTPCRTVRQINHHRDYPLDKRPSLVAPAKAGRILQIFRLVTRFRNCDVEILFRRDGECDRSRPLLSLVGSYLSACRIRNYGNLVLGPLEQRGARR